MIRIIAFFILQALGVSASFAQGTISKELTLYNGSIELPGTLTAPSTAKQLIVWIHGSGDVDRNGNQVSANIKANYIKQFRDSMNKNGIAFFSYDKRTSNPKNKELLKGTKFSDFVDDAKIAVSHFKDENTFKEIILIGHSQGSLVAMLASEGANKYISLAGPSEKINATIVKQVTAQSAELGKTAEAHFKELSETGDIKEVNPFLKTVFAKQNLAFIRNWMEYDPIKEMKKMAIPTLIINGTKDLQVKVEDAQALHKAKVNSTLVIIENMNHVLKVINNDSDNYPSYFSPDFPISEKLVTTITEFVKK